MWTFLAGKLISLGRDHMQKFIAIRQRAELWENVYWFPWQPIEIFKFCFCEVALRPRKVLRVQYQQDPLRNSGGDPGQTNKQPNKWTESSNYSMIYCSNLIEINQMSRFTLKQDLKSLSLSYQKKAWLAPARCVIFLVGSDYKTTSVKTWEYNSIFSVILKEGFVRQVPAKPFVMTKTKIYPQAVSNHGDLAHIGFWLFSVWWNRRGQEEKHWSCQSFTSNRSLVWWAHKWGKTKVSFCTCSINFHVLNTSISVLVLG